MVDPQGICASARNQVIAEQLARALAAATWALPPICPMHKDNSAYQHASAQKLAAVPWQDQLR